MYTEKQQFDRSFLPTPRGVQILSHAVSYGHIQLKVCKKRLLSIQGNNAVEVVAHPVLCSWIHVSGKRVWDGKGGYPRGVTGPGACQPLASFLPSHHFLGLLQLLCATPHYN